MAIVDIKHTQTIEELASKLGEGGSGSGGCMLIINLTFARNPSDASMWAATGDKTGAEIITAIESGKTIALRGDFNGTQNIQTYIAYGIQYATDSSVQADNGVSMTINYNYEPIFSAPLDDVISGSTT